MVLLTQFKLPWFSDREATGKGHIQVLQPTYVSPIWQGSACHGTRSSVAQKLKTLKLLFLITGILDKRCYPFIVFRLSDTCSLLSSLIAILPSTWFLSFLFFYADSSRNVSLFNRWAGVNLLPPIELVHITHRHGVLCRDEVVLSINK